MQTISNVFKWIFVSSADADKVSLSVKTALLGLVPYIMQAIGITCGLHLVCPAVDVGSLNVVAMTLSNIVFWGLSIVAGIGFIYGLVRKIVFSLTGQNAAFAAPQG